MNYKNKPSIPGYSNPQKIQRGNSVQIHAEQTIRSGPIPAPEELIRYNTACPDAADRIIKMAELQAEHRQDIEKTVINAQCRNSLAGIIASVLVSIAVIFCGTYCIVQGYNITGGVLIGGDLATLTGIYLHGTKINKQKENKEK